jgi:hypothetical protein
MALIPSFDRRAVTTGAVVGVAATLPVLIAFQLLDVTEESNLTFVFFAAVFAAWVAAGAVAARLRADAPFAHGTAAALAAWAVFAALRLVALAVRGPSPESDTPTTFVYVAFNGLVAATAGILGATLALRRR